MREIAVFGAVGAETHRAKRPCSVVGLAAAWEGRRAVRATGSLALEAVITRLGRYSKTSRVPVLVFSA